MGSRPLWAAWGPGTPKRALSTDSRAGRLAEVLCEGPGVSLHGQPPKEGGVTWSQWPSPGGRGDIRAVLGLHVSPGWAGSQHTGPPGPRGLCRGQTGHAGYRHINKDWWEDAGEQPGPRTCQTGTKAGPPAPLCPGTPATQLLASQRLTAPRVQSWVLLQTPSKLPGPRCPHLEHEGDHGARLRVGTSPTRGRGREGSPRTRPGRAADSKQGPCSRCGSGGST